MRGAFWLFLPQFPVLVFLFDQKQKSSGSHHGNYQPLNLYPRWEQILMTGYIRNKPVTSEIVEKGPKPEKEKAFKVQNVIMNDRVNDFTK